MILELNVTSIISNFIFYLVTTTCAGSFACLIWKLFERKIDRNFPTGVTCRFLKWLFSFYLFPFVPLIIWILRLIRNQSEYQETIIMQSSSIIAYFYYAVGFIWFVGFIYRVWKYISACLNFKYRIADLSGELKNDITKLCFEKLGEDLGLRRHLNIYVSSDIVDPCIFGIFRPKIYLPESVYSETNLMVVLRHELVHYKHKDILFKRLNVIAQCIHWFNPLTSWLNKKLNIWMEFHCDESCCYHYKNPCNGRHYFNTILEFSLARKKNIYYVASKCSEDGNQLKERIIHMSQRKNRKALRKSLVILGIFVLMTSGASTAVAAGFQYLLIHDAVYEVTKVEIEEENIISTTEDNIEIIDSYADEDIAEVVIEGPPLMTRAASGTYTWTIPANTRYITPSFSTSGASYIHTSCTITTGTTARMGVKEPDSTYRYITVTNTGAHSFKINKSGSHQFYIQNTGSSSITVTATYSVN